MTVGLLHSQQQNSHAQASLRMAPLSMAGCLPVAIQQNAQTKLQSSPVCWRPLWRSLVNLFRTRGVRERGDLGVAKGLTSIAKLSVLEGMEVSLDGTNWIEPCAAAEQPGAQHAAAPRASTVHLAEESVW